MTMLIIDVIVLIIIAFSSDIKWNLFSHYVDSQQYYKATKIFFRNNKMLLFYRDALNKFDKKKFQQFVYSLYGYIKAKTVESNKEILDYTVINLNKSQEAIEYLYKVFPCLKKDENFKDYLKRYDKSNNDLFSINTNDNKDYDRNVLFDINFLLLYLELIDRNIIQVSKDFSFKKFCINTEFKSHNKLIVQKRM